MFILSKSVQEFIRDYGLYLNGRVLRDSESNIQVDEIASKIAVFYEKTRNIIDYQEKHLLRKRIIERALKRRIFLKDISGHDIAESLIKEIVRSGHLGNNTVPEYKILDVQIIIDNLILLLDAIKNKEGIKKSEFSSWLMGISVCAIENVLSPSLKGEMLIDFALNIFRENLAINSDDINDKDINTLLFIGLNKALLKVDEDQLNYNALNFLYPQYSLDKKDVPDFFTNLSLARDEINNYLRHPFSPLFLKFCNRFRIVFYAIGDLVFQGKGFENLDSDLKSFYEERREREKKRLFRMAFLSIISFFLSKILVAFAIEIPIDFYITHSFSLLHTAANIIFPPVLMGLIVSSIRLPSEKNFYLLSEEVRAMVFEERRRQYSIQIPKKKNRIMESAIRFVYLSIFFVALYFLSRLLFGLGFSAANIVVFILFTSIVSATGVKIFNQSKVLSLEKERARFLSFLLDIFAIPLVVTGKWLLSGLKRFNVLIILVNFIIELPFQIFIEFLESFNAFLRTKKEEIE